MSTVFSATFIVRHAVAVLVRRRFGPVADHQHRPVGRPGIISAPQRHRAVQSGRLVPAGPLQGQPAHLRVRPGLAAFGAGRVAVRAEEHQTAVVPQAAPETQHGQQVCDDRSLICAVCARFVFETF